MKQSMDKNITGTSGHNGVSTEASLPHQRKGYAMESKTDDIGICPFYDFCLVNKGVAVQITCLNSNSIFCKNNTQVKNLSDF